MASSIDFFLSFCSGGRIGGGDKGRGERGDRGDVGFERTESNSVSFANSFCFSEFSLGKASNWGIGDRAGAFALILTTCWSP